MKPEAILEGAAAHHQSLHGRVALVTGSSSGIGLGIARAFCARGMNVLLNGFGNAGEIERLRAGLAEEFAVDVRSAAADISKAEAIEEMVATAVVRVECRSPPPYWARTTGSR